MTFSRANPSPRYRELLGFYAQLHDHGDAALNIPADQMFAGQSLYAHANFIHQLIQAFQSKSLLDYGSGKGEAYRRTDFKTREGQIVGRLQDYWKLDEIALYDPGYEPYATLPDRKFHAVISTDVMEHIPEQDVDWVIDELLSHAEHFVYACISTYPAQKSFPDGSNVHVTLRDPDWWTQRFDARRAALQSSAEYVLLFDHGNEKASEIVYSF